ncbi:MAG: HPP family protein [Thermodesulfovibrionales bacterium]
MKKNKVVKDLMIDVFKYPHVPYWFTIRQTMMIIKKSLIESEKHFYPLAILIFDEKYNLLGTLSMKDIIRGLEPRFMKTSEKAQAYISEEKELSIIWDTLFTKESKQLAEKPVSDIMVPAKFFVEPDDPITKAAYIMISHGLDLLPVLDNKKFVGLIRMPEIFDELSNVILKE